MPGMYLTWMENNSKFVYALMNQNEKINLKLEMKQKSNFDI